MIKFGPGVVKINVILLLIRDGSDCWIPQSAPFLDILHCTQNQKIDQIFPAKSKSVYSVVKCCTVGLCSVWTQGSIAVSWRQESRRYWRVLANGSARSRLQVTHGVHGIQIVVYTVQCTYYLLLTIFCKKNSLKIVH